MNDTAKTFIISLVLVAIASFLIGYGIASAATIDLSHWKLQIPGPKDIMPIGNYSSKYFNQKDGVLTFWVDSKEKGSTSGSEYVRSELREMLNPKDSKVNWLLKGSHSIKADIEVTKAGADQITVLQIHGIKKDGGSVPPLLRLAVIKGDLYAWVKTNSSGSKTEKVLLKKGVGRFTTEVLIKDSQMTIKVGGETKLTRNLSFWKHYNYFKAGNYPQAHEGISEVKFYGAPVVSH